MTAEREDWGMDRGPILTSHRVDSTDGVTVAVYELGAAADPAGPTVLFCHPTGFHGLVWAPVVAQLNAQLNMAQAAPAVRSLAVDFRGHGDSSLPTTGDLAWSGMAADVLAVVDGLGVDGPLVGIGHSMGGASLLLAEQARPGLLTSVWAYEPIVFPTLPDGPRPANPLSAATRRRKATFPDRATALANYAAKPPLNTLAPEALEAYVDHGFRDRPDGSIELKCAPDTEAQVYEGGADNGAFEALAEVKCPVTVVAGGDGGYPAQVAPRVAEALPHGQLQRFERLSHFGPMEDPAAIAAAIRESQGL